MPIAYEPAPSAPEPQPADGGSWASMRQFGIEEAEASRRWWPAKEICRAGPRKRSTRSARCAVRSGGARWRTRIASMSRAERKALMRYMAQEGAAPAVLRRLFGDRERPTTNRLYIPISGVWYADRAVTAACRCRRCGLRAALAGRAGT
ncbi:MAG: hypothetical protein ACLUQ6_00770 [Alistipes onderdonkii]